MSIERFGFLFVKRSLPLILFNAVVCALCLAVAFGLAEIVFRTAGTFKRHRIYHSTVLAHTKNESIILCVGDSHTQGVGAPENLDYPAQLSTVLNADRKCPKKFRVVNLGYAGFNSSQSTNTLLQYLKEHAVRPELVIFNAGRNNDHSFSEASFLPDDVRKLAPSDQLNYLFSNSRAFRFGVITRYRLKQWLNNYRKGTLNEDDQFIFSIKPSEKELLQKWLESDIERLDLSVKEAGGRLALLNYVYSPSWLHDTYQESSQKLGIPLIDVRFLQYAPTARIWINRYYMKAAHPNEYGYAAIADLVYAEMENLGIVPSACTHQPNP